MDGKPIKNLNKLAIGAVHVWYKHQSDFVSDELDAERLYFHHVQPPSFKYNISYNQENYDFLKAPSTILDQLAN
jgi:hypothetical protein